MKNENISILGFDVVRHNVPESVQEINELAKDESAAYNMAMNQWFYHTDFSKLRPAICAKVEEITGVERGKKEEEGARGPRIIFTEKEKEYLDRVNELVEDGEIELEAGTLQEAVQAAVDSVPVSFEKSVRGTGGSATPAKKWLAYYDDASEQDIVAEKVENINNSSYYTGAKLDADDEDIRVKFALACKEIITKKTKEISEI